MLQHAAALKFHATTFHAALKFWLCAENCGDGDAVDGFNRFYPEHRRGHFCRRWYTDNFFFFSLGVWVLDGMPVPLRLE